eukprot:c18969_g1_i1.p1 GENE.c18969_g1_i1~~c18969_g1_i1.p1  ORF type:complete len:423 (+),score=141.81 c18969_g1_i1:33-1271(+)
MAEVGPTPDTEDLKQEEPASKPADKPQETPKEKPKELPKDQPNKHLTRATALEETLKEHLAKVDNAQTLSAADAKRINKAVKAKIKDIQAKLSKSETPEAKLEACIEQLTEQIRALKVAEREIELRRDAQDANTTYTNQLVSDASRIAKVNLNLESLCRELQTQNKSIVELNAQVIADEKEKREKQQAKVDEVVQTINVKLGEQEQESIKVATENAQLREQVSRLKAQCEAMETYIKAALTEKELEVKIHKTKCEQMEAMLEESKTKLVQFLDLLQSREQELNTSRAQVAVYEEKYTEMQTSIVGANASFIKFKSEMAELVKQQKRENNELRTKQHHTDLTMVKQHEEIQGLQKQLAQRKEALDKAEAKKASLEGLCRTLTAKLKGQAEPQPVAQEYNPAEQVPKESDSGAS